MKSFNVTYLCSLNSSDLTVVTESWRKVNKMSVDSNYYYFFHIIVVCVVFVTEGERLL